MKNLPSFESSYTIDKCFMINPLQKGYLWLGRVMSAIFIIFGVLFFGGLIYAQFREGQFSFAITIFPLTFLLIAIIQFIVMFNLHTDISLNQEYLFVDFFFQLKYARLDDLIAIKPVVTPSQKQSFVILFKEGLTPYHRLYGWIFGLSLYPGVYVGASLENRDELERLLQRRLLMNGR